MKISSGSKDFDEFLNGGYESDIITAIYGPAGSGKTNLCILAAVGQAKNGKKVLFIDTEGGFSMERLKQINESCAKNIILCKVTSFYEQNEILKKIARGISKDISLIILDSIAMFYRLEASIAREKGDKKIEIINRTLAKQLRILNEIARKKNIPVIITDQVYSDFLSNEKIERLKEDGIDINEEKAKNVRMVGGDLLKYWCKCIIELQKLKGKRKAILRKHRSMPEKEFSFIITEKGIEKSGFRLF